MLGNPVLEKLRQQVNALEGTQSRFSCTVPVADVVDRWLPYGGLSIGCIHEVKGSNLASAIAFSAILSARIAQEYGNILYVASHRSLHPLGLLSYGVKVGQLLYVSPRRQQDLAWVVMEALRCSQVSSVIAVLDDLDLTESRRLQLAAETSKATAFLLGTATSASIASPITRWRVSPVNRRIGQRFDQPVWELDLLYCRSGRPGRWIVEWHDRQLNAISTQPTRRVEHEALAG